MKASELRELSAEELERRVAELRDEAFKLRLRRATEQLPNPLRLRALRRETARCLTEIAARRPARAERRQTPERTDGKD